MPLGDLLAVALDAASSLAGPWSPGAVDSLTWAYRLASTPLEGFVADLPDDGVAMLRYCGGERTLWLYDVFGEPQPTDAPSLSGAVNGAKGVDPRSSDSQRWLADQSELEGRLGRPSS